MTAHEIVQLYHESLDRKTFIENMRTDIEENEAGMYWNLIDAAIESEQP